MKIILVGAHGTVGTMVRNAFKDSPHEVITVGKSSGDFQVDIEDAASIRALYKKIGSFDAVAVASGDVTFAPLANLTGEQWRQSVQSKLLGQINLVQEALPFIKEGGSFTLIAGVLGDEQILAGTVAATVNYALIGFAKAAALELPKKLRINVVSPTVLKEAMGAYGDFFPGFIPVEGEKVGQAFKRSILGIQTGRVLPVY